MSNGTPDPVALVSAPALGDGLLALVLARNLHLQGRPSILYHSQLTPVRAWFPWARIEPLPAAAQRLAAFSDCRALFIGDPALLPRAAREGPGRLVFTKDCWDRSRPYLRSLQRHAERVFDVCWSTDENGLRAPEDLEPRAHPRRVVLHPFSARPNKDWPVPRWTALAARLRGLGWEPVVLLAPGEEARWSEAAAAEVPTAVPGPLDAVAAWLHASAAAVAGDSGIGHLASALGLPTVSIFRKASAARFWRPVWGRTAVVTAPLRLPGSAGHRHWGRLLTPRRVARRLARLAGMPLR